MTQPSFSITCRRAAVLSDIHSNYHAFQACYEDALLQGADCFLFLGDYVSDLADPVKTMDLVYEIQSKYPTFCLRGNRERYMLEYEQGKAVFVRGSKSGSLLYTFEQLRPHDLDFFRGLPIYDTVRINDVSFELSHAVRYDDRYYFEKDSQQISEVFQGMKWDYLLTGHSHKQYMQEQNGKTIINPGSVGIPQGGSRCPQYALLDFEEGAVYCHLRQVSYPMEKAIHAQFRNGLVDYAKYWAISILYDIITGEDYTITLLQRVLAYANGAEDAIRDEGLWHRTAAEMGMRFTEDEILAFLRACNPPLL